MRKIAFITACATVAAVGFAPAAFAKHKRHAAAVAPVAPAASPVVDAQGQFYATPVSAGPASAAVLGVPVPGLDLATGVAGPVLAVPAAALAVPGQILPGLVPTP